MTAEEAEAVFLAGVPGPAAELGLGTVITAARLKVLAALPSSSGHVPRAWWSASTSTLRDGSGRAIRCRLRRWPRRCGRVAACASRTSAATRRWSGCWSRSGWFSRAGSGTSSPRSRASCAPIGSLASRRQPPSRRSSIAAVSFDLRRILGGVDRHLREVRRRLEVVVRIDPNALGALAEFGRRPGPARSGIDHAARADRLAGRFCVCAWSGRRSAAD